MKKQEAKNSHLPKELQRERKPINMKRLRKVIEQIKDDVRQSEEIRKQHKLDEAVELILNTKNKS